MRYSQTLCLWQPIPGVIWDARDGVLAYPLWGLFGLGWALVFASTFAVSHFDLFGLRQIWLNFKGQPYTPVEFKQNIFYRYVRHPLMLGFFIALWATPYMTWSHVLLAGGFTAYIFIGTHYEERDLIAHFGETYQRYRERVSMILPLPKGPKGE